MVHWLIVRKVVQMGTNRPLYRPLSDRDAIAIDDGARRILREIGIHVDDDLFLAMFETAGASVDRAARTVRCDAALLDKLIRMAPTQFTLYSRDDKNNLHMGSGKVHFGNGGRVFRILDMGTGGYRATLSRDIVHTATLVDNLDNINLYIIACQAHDISQKHYHTLDFYLALNHTTKHVMGGCDNLRGVQQMWQLATVIAGGADAFEESPFVSVITNPISPLIFDENTLQILQFCVTHGIPVTCATAPIAGATAPATLAGTLSLMHAEALAGVAIAQMFSAGSKVLYGAFPTVMDMKTMGIATGSVEMGMLNTCAVQLAKLYDLPIYASGGLTESKQPDIQAGFEKNFSNLTVALMGADFIHLTAGLMDSANSLSYEQFVIDDENIGMIHRVLAGINVDTDSLAFDVVQHVGPGGHFLMEDHTTRHLDELFYPVLAERCSFEVWEENDEPNMLKRAKSRVSDILERNPEGLLDRSQIEAVEDNFPFLRNT